MMTIIVGMYVERENNKCGMRIIYESVIQWENVRKRFSFIMIFTIFVDLLDISKIKLMTILPEAFSYPS